MKIIICNVPIRAVTDACPPVGSTRVIKSLIDNGFKDVLFYNLDLVRPKDTEIIDYFKKNTPDIVGISAIVSTSYRYVKHLSLLIKKNFPDIPIILGGNMAASSKVILNKSSVDICALGDGENTIVKLARHWEKYKNFQISDDFREIKGIAYIDNIKGNELVLTGYAEDLSRDQVRQVDYDLIGDEDALKYYLPLATTREDIRRDKRSKETHRQGKRIAYITTSKGCVNRCTFCHRWGKGYKVFGVDTVIAYIKGLKDRYDIGYFTIGDENFGSDKKKAIEFVEKIKELDLLWTCSGVRVKTLNVDLLKKMKESGCVALYYGMESGSDKMLTVMEKRATVENNLQALKNTQEAGLYTIVQLVIGMPGETNETIKETSNFLRQAVNIFKYDFPLQVSINYAQALPGTPLYEYARMKGFIGRSIDEEEEYLLKISDIDACKFDHYINMTSEKLADVLVWVDRLDMEIQKVHDEIKKKRSSILLNDDKAQIKKYVRGDFFRLSRANPIIIIIFKLLGNNIFYLLKIWRCIQYKKSILKGIKLFIFSRKKKDVVDISLRKVVSNEVLVGYGGYDVKILRDGR